VISPDQQDLEAGLDPGERAGFRFTEDPTLVGWVFSHCLEELDEDGSDAACAGCAGYGYECWSVWVRHRTVEEPWPR
jgi:hypothetical protein